MRHALIDEHAARVTCGRAALDAVVGIPGDAAGVVIFAHGSGSGRHSPRNRYVAEQFQHAGLATLLIDLLTPSEESMDAMTGEMRFDIPLLADRVIGAAHWAGDEPALRGLPVGLFGASTGAAAALMAAARDPRRFSAVVSRGGRPDLAGASLPRVQAPTLLIVGGADLPVLALNRAAMGQMRARTRLEIVPGATHLFEEPGTLEEVSRLAANWFRRHLR